MTSENSQSTHHDGEIPSSAHSDSGEQFHHSSTINGSSENNAISGDIPSFTPPNVELNDTSAALTNDIEQEITGTPCESPQEQTENENASIRNTEQVRYDSNHVAENKDGVSVYSDKGHGVSGLGDLGYNLNLNATIEPELEAPTDRDDKPVT